MKNFFKSIFIIGLSLVMLSSCVLRRPAKEEAAARFITVSGSGSVTVKPDMLSLNFIVRNTGWNCPQTAEKNALLSKSAIDAIKEAGISESDISTYDYSITQDNTHSYAGEYTVTNIINVIIRRLDMAGAVIDAAIKSNSGANGLTSFEYLVSDKSTALREARTLAVKNAQDAAALLAGASGCKVSNVLEIREDYTTAGRQNNHMMGSFDTSSSGAKTQLLDGNITITSNVTIKFEINN